MIDNYESDHSSHWCSGQLLGAVKQGSSQPQINDKSTWFFWMTWSPWVKSLGFEIIGKTHTLDISVDSTLQEAMVFPIIGFTGLLVNFLLNTFFDIFDGYPDLHTTYLQHQAIHFGGLINSDPYLYIYTLYVHYIYI